MSLKWLIRGDSSQWWRHKLMEDNGITETVGNMILRRKCSSQGNLVRWWYTRYDIWYDLYYMSHHVTRPSKSSDIRSERTFFRSGLPGLMNGPIRWRYSKRDENNQSNFGIITEVKSDWSIFWPIKIKTWPTMASSLPEFELNLKFPFPCVGMYESNCTGVVQM